MTTANKVLEIARKEIGYIEGKGNNNKYGKELNENNVSWCALFVLYCLIHAGMDVYKPLTLKYSYCPAWWAAFKIQKLNVTVPKSGDIVFYSWDGSGIAEHVGLVDTVLPNGNIIAIEGNTAPTGTGSQSNGDGVYRKTREKRFIVGFGRPYRD
jgi:hypothetical protein